jgi:hypothetical protein
MANGGRSPGPGLAKARSAPLLRRRLVELVAASDGRLRELFDGADVVSEGSARMEGRDLVYYGSTSVLLGSSREQGAQAIEELARMATLDPHVRVRAVRIARREASARAGGPIGTLHAEVSFREARRADRGGAPGEAEAVLSLAIDVSAIVLQGGARSRLP